MTASGVARNSMGVILALIVLLAAAHAAAAPTETFAIAAAPQTLAVGALSGYQPVRPPIGSRLYCTLL